MMELFIIYLLGVFITYFVLILVEEEENCPESIFFSLAWPAALIVVVALLIATPLLLIRSLALGLKRRLRK